MGLYQEVTALKEQRARLIAEGRKYLEDAESAGRGGEKEVEENHAARMAEISELGKRIERAEQLEAAERRQFAVTGNTEPVAKDAGRELDPEQRKARRSALSTKALRHFIVNGRSENGGLSPEEFAEARALQVDVDTSGGYTRPDEQFMAMLLKGVDDIVAIRGLATKFQVTNAESIGVPYLSARASNAAWTTELQTGSADTQMAFGKRSLTPNPLAKRILVSEKLLRSSALPVEQIVTNEMAYVFGITAESAYASGSGANQPLGMFTASASGIDTDRDVSTGNSATSITFDGLKEAKWTLKPQYQGAARWLFHRDALKQIDKLKDGDGKYIWQPSVVPGSPDMILGKPVVVSDYVPNTFTTGLYVGMYADFSYFWIVDALSFRLQRLNELYAESGQVGFIGRLESDGMPVLSEAFVRVKLG